MKTSESCVHLEVVDLVKKFGDDTVLDGNVVANINLLKQDGVLYGSV